MANTPVRFNATRAKTPPHILSRKSLRKRRSVSVLPPLNDSQSSSECKCSQETKWIDFSSSGSSSDFSRYSPLPDIGSGYDIHSDSPDEESYEFVRTGTYRVKKSVLSSHPVIDGQEYQMCTKNSVSVRSATTRNRHSKIQGHICSTTISKNNCNNNKIDNIKVYIKLPDGRLMMTLGEPTDSLVNLLERVHGLEADNLVLCTNKDDGSSEENEICSSLEDLGIEDSTVIDVIMDEDDK